VSRRYQVWPWLIAAALTVSLSACGKKSNLEPPEDTAASYTYPRTYPNPASVLSEKDEERKTETRPAPPHAGGLSPFPADRTTTTTYQSAPSQ
jgi:predicted small lipoprotein YifL